MKKIHERVKDAVIEEPKRVYDKLKKLGRCPLTVSGKHLTFPIFIRDTATEKGKGYKESSLPPMVWKCIACGLIDDTK